MKTLLTGATGLVGANLAHLLCELVLRMRMARHATALGISFHCRSQFVELDAGHDSKPSTRR